MRKEATAEVKPDEEWEGGDTDNFSAAFLDVIRATSSHPRNLGSTMSGAATEARSAPRRPTYEVDKKAAVIESVGFRL